MNQSKISDKKIGFYEQVCTQTLDKTLEITDERIFSENGKIYRESWFIPIDDDSEVVLMPYMQGG